jgi:hypothetical protein
MRFQYGNLSVLSEAGTFIIPELSTAAAFNSQIQAL